MIQNFTITSHEILKRLSTPLFADGYGDTCPKGFILDTASYCAGMLLSFSMPHLLCNICRCTSSVILIKCVFIR